MKINIGSSARIFPGFIHFDRTKHPGVQLCDIRLGLPLGTGTVDVVVASHVLEHLHPFNELPSVLADLRRVLKPGGLLRVAVPDLAVLVRAYLGKDPALANALGATQTGLPWAELPAALRFSAIAYGDNSGSASYDGHRVCFDFGSLAWVLNRAGFKDVASVKPGESRDPELMKSYSDVGAPEEIIVEAVRP